MKKNFKKIFFLYLFLFFPCFLSAEIELLTVKWVPQQCALPSCVENVISQFRRLSGTAELVVSQNDGQATVRWKPYSPFSYTSLIAAMSATGLRPREIRLRVRGTIVRSSNAFFLRSLGDNTMFVLLGPAQASMTKNIPQNSLDSYPLSLEMQQQLLDAEQNFIVTVVEGPLFTALRQRDIYLIVNSLTLNRLGPGAIPGSR